LGFSIPGCWQVSNANHSLFTAHFTLSRRRPTPGTGCFEPDQGVSGLRAADRFSYESAPGLLGPEGRTPKAAKCLGTLVLLLGTLRAAADAERVREWFGMFPSELPYWNESLGKRWTFCQIPLTSNDLSSITSRSQIFKNRAGAVHVDLVRLISK